MDLFRYLFIAAVVFIVSLIVCVLFLFVCLFPSLVSYPALKQSTLLFLPEPVRTGLKSAASP